MAGRAFHWAADVDDATGAVRVRGSTFQVIFQVPETGLRLAEYLLGSPSLLQRLVPGDAASDPLDPSLDLVDPAFYLSSIHVASPKWARSKLPGEEGPAFQRLQA